MGCSHSSRVVISSIDSKDEIYQGNNTGLGFPLNKSNSVGSSCSPRTEVPAICAPEPPILRVNSEHVTVHGDDDGTPVVIGNVGAINSFKVALVDGFEVKVQSDSWYKSPRPTLHIRVR